MKQGKAEGEPDKKSASDQPLESPKKWISKAVGAQRLCLAHFFGDSSGNPEGAGR
ncbi:MULTISPECIES: hypothetical protein [unclassified Herbaspirillum]|uniref:hypothetical protein n=1 Tax=unclassified Herbaspirillum TaxID=2624150 RepID=UPI00160DD1AE|nr:MULTISPECIES: hypothetical protein [unclassified Herbaspirillum]MBB5391476.1 hypothetical protein [Herbaspirillum sp. SJZ102]